MDLHVRSQATCSNQIRDRQNMQEALAGLHYNGYGPLLLLRCVIWQVSTRGSRLAHHECKICTVVSRRSSK